MLFSLLLAFSLSLDALGIGLSYGLRSIRFRPSALLLLTIEAFLMMELFLFAGRRLAAVFPAHLAERFSPMLLLFFGVWLCLQGMGQGKRKETSPLHSPSLCDKNASSLIASAFCGFLCHRAECCRRRDKCNAPAPLFCPLSDIFPRVGRKMRRKAHPLPCSEGKPLVAPVRRHFNPSCRPTAFGQKISVPRKEVRFLSRSCLRPYI